MTRSFTLPGGHRLVGEMLQQPLEPSQLRALTWLSWHRQNEGGSTRDAFAAAAPSMTSVIICAITKVGQGTPAPAAPPPAPTPVAPSPARVVAIARTIGAWLRRALCSSGLRVWQ